MILISHRGNITGKNKEEENKPEYIQLALDSGYDVEIDIWLFDGAFYLGHDEAQYEISTVWLKERRNDLWIHCKNLEALLWFSLSEVAYNYFWHQNDDFTLTSKNIIWAFPGKKLTERSVSVLPELNGEIPEACFGICSDIIGSYNE